MEEKVLHDCQPTDPCGPDDPKDFVRKFLLEKNFCDDQFIDEVIEQGLTDDIIEHLQCEGLCYEDIITIGKLLKKDNSSSNLCNCTFQSETEISSKKDYIESAYLKENFGEILPLALREIVTKKPYNPVEYLGHWLLHYRECDEREKRRKEFEEELLEERSKLQKPIVAWEPPDEREGEEEHEINEE